MTVKTVTLLLKGGPAARLALTQLQPREPAWLDDTHELVVGGADGLPHIVGAQDSPTLNQGNWVPPGLALPPGEFAPLIIKQGTPTGPPQWWPQIMPGELAWHTGLKKLYIGDTSGAPQLVSAGQQVEAMLTTTDNVSHPILTFPLNANSAYGIYLRLTGYRTGGSAGSAGDSFDKIYSQVGVRNVAGVASFIGGIAPTGNGSGDNLSVNSSVNVSSGNFVASVQGDTNNIYDWKLLLRVETLSS